MSENKVPRSKEEVQNEYSQLCARAGHTQYRIAITKKDIAILEGELDKMNDTLRDLNFEALAVSNAEAKKEENKDESQS